MPQYTLPAKERGDSTLPEGYEQQRLATTGTARIAKMQNVAIGESTGKKIPQVKAWACIDEGPLAGKCVLFTRGLDEKGIWSLKYALRDTHTDEGIPANQPYTFKDDNDIINRVNRMAGVALLKVAEIGDGHMTLVDYFVDAPEASKYEEAQPITDAPDKDDFDL